MVRASKAVLQAFCWSAKADFEIAVPGASNLAHGDFIP